MAFNVKFMQKKLDCVWLWVTTFASLSLRGRKLKRQTEHKYCAWNHECCECVCVRPSGSLLGRAWKKSDDVLRAPLFRVRRAERSSL
jgi:hypothetical protein